MSDAEQQPQQPTPPPVTPQVKSDKRTAEFIVRRLEDIQEQIIDLYPEFRTLDRYEEIANLGWPLQGINAIKRKCRKFVEMGVWEDD